ncbi:substrate-binding domain-containing protein [Paracraurococcus lichenis]|uniref:Substrate-binding domain-containing protein n=1 Tax=Paracraurococcus lichenis TaxID=3064888 RepID=A0ABT9DYV7_9PROT|nr:substrate-binding domain-containing protein [Paracraurococcus sp. LOR1-02]MDO9709091.1 substrate-binding domain-containing protein [Paracraurococcus sp. LOR1-02]
MTPALTRRHALAAGAATLLLARRAAAAEIRIVSSGGFAAAYKALAPGFEKETGHSLAAGWGPSMGQTPQAVPARLARGEPIDVVIMVGYALGKLVEEGKVLADSRADLARSGIGVAVRAGAPHPRIGTVEELRQTLLAAKSVAYSDSASGVYIEREMLKRMGIAEQLAGRARMIPAEPVGEVVARGGAEIGFQQLSELKPIHGIDILGPLPSELQQYTVFSAGVVATSREPEAARALVRYLASPEAAPAILESGMEPLAKPR